MVFTKEKYDNEYKYVYYYRDSEEFLFKIESFKNGKADGRFVVFYDNGIIEKELFYDNDEIIRAIFYYENGNVKLFLKKKTNSFQATHYTIDHKIETLNAYKFENGIFSPQPLRVKPFSTKLNLNNIKRTHN